MLRKFTCALACILFLVPPCADAAPEGLRLGSRVRAELERIPAYRQASKAMADRLPEVAVGGFRDVLESPKLGKNAKPAVQLMLAEALVRASIDSGGNAKQSTEALKILDGKDLAGFPSAAVWRVEALASLGRYGDAEKALGDIASSHPYFAESRLAQSRILIALGQTDKALTVLDGLAKSKKSAVRSVAALLAAELLIDAGKNTLALEALENAETGSASAAKLREYLAARVALAGGKAAEAVNRFQSLTTAPDHLSMRIFHACFLGLADSQVANKDKEAAAETLQEFIAEHPDSYALQAAFERLIALLPGEAAADDPAMKKLREWSGEKPLLPRFTLLGAAGGPVGIGTTGTAQLEHRDLAALALFYRARLLSRAADEPNLQQALALHARLRCLYLGSTQSPSELYLRLFSASLLDTSYIYLQQKQPGLATYSLSVMEKITYSPELKTQASMRRGEILASKGDFGGAMQAFLSAQQASSGVIAEAASVNAGIMALKSSNLEAFGKIVDTSDNAAVRTSLTLERALWKCGASEIQGRNDLEAFIMANPGHPRENEARLALAAACVNTTPPDITLAKAQLEIISPRMTDAAAQAQITRIRIRAESLHQNWLAAAQAAETFLARFETAPQAAAIQFKCGEAYYQNEDYNKARRIFQGLEKKYPENTLNPYAKFYGAMAARLGGTAQSREECIAMFQEIIDSKHPLAPEARIQQSRVLIDLQRYGEAEKSLKPLMTGNADSPDVRLGAGVLMADCLQRQGIAEPGKIRQAVAIYHELLEIKGITPAWSHRLHYLRGQAYENMKNTSEAFRSYYSVIVNGRAPEDPQSKQEEWFWFYRCGFKALAMLEDTKRWEASVKVAKRIASFNGPRKEEAYNRAKELARTHMIWQDEDPDDSPDDRPGEQQKPDKKE